LVLPLIFRSTQLLMDSPEVVTPVKTGAQRTYNHLKTLNFVLRRNDRKNRFQALSNFINYFPVHISKRFASRALG
jgi:hypothetical protein